MGGDDQNGGGGNGQQPTASATPSDTLAPKRSRPSRPSLATITAGGGVQLEVNRAVSGDDGFTVVFWTLSNTSNSEIDLSEFFYQIEVEYGNMSYFQDQYPWYLSDSMLIEVVLPDEDEWYPPITDTGSECLCGVLANDLSSLPPGESIETYSTYYLPPGTKNIAIDFPGTDKLVKDISIEPVGSGG